MLYVIVWLLKKPSFLGKSDMVDEENKTQLLLLGKFENTGGRIFKVVLEC